MNILRRRLRWGVVLIAVLALGAGALWSAQNASPSGGAQATVTLSPGPAWLNYQHCLLGFYTCDPGQLTMEQQQAVTRAKQQRAVLVCSYATVGCEKVEAEQKQAAADMARRRNLENCLRGFDACDTSQLSAEEQSTVAEAARRRTYSDCKRGFYACSASTLSGEQHEKVTKAARKRNYQSCLHGWYGCDATQLTAEQQQALTEAASKRIY